MKIKILVKFYSLNLKLDLYKKTKRYFLFNQVKHLLFPIQINSILIGSKDLFRNLINKI